jgi:hypothetical protein
MSTVTQLLERALEALQDVIEGCEEPHKTKTAIKDIEAYLAKQPVEQEPVAWHTDDHLTDRSATTYRKDMAYAWECKGWPVTPLYTQPSGSLIVHKGCKATWANGVIEVKPVEQEPMSDDELDQLMFDCGLSATARDIARAIEAKLNQ